MIDITPCHCKWACHGMSRWPVYFFRHRLQKVRDFFKAWNGR